MYLSSDACNKIRLIMKDRWRDGAIVVLAGIDAPSNHRPLACDVTYEADADWPERAPGSFKLVPVSWSMILVPAGIENSYGIIRNGVNYYHKSLLKNALFYFIFGLRAI